jgi:hypothetical protein
MQYLPASILFILLTILCICSIVYFENQIDDWESALGSPLLWRFLEIKVSRIVSIEQAVS